MPWPKPRTILIKTLKADLITQAVCSVKFSVHLLVIIKQETSNLCKKLSKTFNKNYIKLKNQDSLSLPFPHLITDTRNTADS